MNDNPSGELGPIPQAILLKAIQDFQSPSDVKLPETVIEAELNFTDAEQRLRKLRQEIRPRSDATAKRQARRKELEQKAEDELTLKGEISSGVSGELDALDRSDKQAGLQRSDDEAALEAAVQNLALQREFHQNALRRYFLNDVDGPVQKAISELEEILEFLPYTFVNLIRLYDYARTELGWDPHHQPLPSWYGPAGVLLDSLQHMRWPEWPAQVRPSWAPRHGKAPTAEDILKNFNQMISDATTKKEAA